MFRFVCAAALILAFVKFQPIEGHGMIMRPVNRASMWRMKNETYSASAPADYNDNELFCGGYGVQYQQNNGSCGLCGDNFADPTPRAHEHGGTYGQGVIVDTYKEGSLIPTEIKLTSNHLGYFTFKICKMDGGNETKECFDQNPVLFEDGSNKYKVPAETFMFYPRIQLPAGLNCKHCVLQWTYTAGNNWGWCDEEQTKGEVGCGDQETFMGCSDISITK